MTFRIDVKTPADMGVAPVTALAPVPGAGNTQPASDSGSSAIRDHEAASDPHPQYLPRAGGTMTGGILGVLGTPANVTYGFVGDSNTGVYSPSPNILGFVAAGAEYLRLDVNNVTYNQASSVPGTYGVVVGQGSRTANVGRFSIDSTNEVMRLESSGTYPLVFSVNGLETFRLPSNGAVRLRPLTTAPSSPSLGDFYYDTTLSQFRGWTGTSWTPFSGSGGGGGGGGSAPLNADSTPAAPNAMDDEFDVGASIDLTGARRSGATAWAWVNQGAATALQGQGHVVVNAPASAGANLRGIEQPISGTAWRVRAKLSAWFGPSGQDFLIGIFLRNSANSRLFSFQKRTNPAPVLSSIRWTTPTTGVTTVQTLDAFSPPPARNSRVPMYFEIELAAGVLTLRYSDTGVDGTFELFGTEVVSAHLLAISHIGLYSYAPPTAGAWGCWDWFRRVA